MRLYRVSVLVTSIYLHLWSTWGDLGGPGGQQYHGKHQEAFETASSRLLLPAASDVVGVDWLYSGGEWGLSSNVTPYIVSSDELPDNTINISRVHRTHTGEHSKLLN